MIDSSGMQTEMRITEHIQDEYSSFVTHLTDWHDLIHILAQISEIGTAIGTVIIAIVTVELYFQNKPPTPSIVRMDSAFDVGVIK